MTKKCEQMQKIVVLMRHIVYIYISIFIYIYISLQIINIWHYINSHYRYDIQEMKINLPKELPFFIW